MEHSTRYGFLCGLISTSFRMFTGSSLLRLVIFYHMLVGRDFSILYAVFCLIRCPANLHRYYLLVCSIPVTFAIQCKHTLCSIYTSDYIIFSFCPSKQIQSETVKVLDTLPPLPFPPTDPVHHPLQSILLRSVHPALHRKKRSSSIESTVALKGQGGSTTYKKPKTSESGTPSASNTLTNNDPNNNNSNNNNNNNDNSSTAKTKTEEKD